MELVAGLSAQAWYLGDRVSVGGGYVGRGLVTEEGSFDERTAHRVGACANLAIGRFVPGIQFRFPRPSVGASGAGTARGSTPVLRRFSPAGPPPLQLPPTSPARDPSRA